jgi:Rad52/22 family double-strand break repair protein
MNRELLEKPFEPAQIKQRQGRNGRLDYVEGHSIVHRLNEALDGAWSFEITQHEVREDEVWVLGKLTAEGITKMQFGVSQVTRERNGGALVSLGDDLKAAATDSLKKCATFLGVGLHLYADKPLNGRGAAAHANGGPPRTPSGPALPGAAAPDAPRPGAAGTNGHVAQPAAAGRVTQRQLDAIVKIALAKNVRPVEIDAISVRKFKRKPAALTVKEASDLIQELSNLPRATAH